ncbi:MAG: leucine-rich repeat domain-containing protein, partial [Promethearchaeota archaeon]
MIELDPSRIYEDFLQNLIDKYSAIDKLIILIENSNNVQIRLNSIRFLEKIGGNFREDASIKEKVFKLFENLLISDSNEKIRNIAARLLGEKFLENSLNPLRWALLHEQSTLCLKTIFQLIITIIKNLNQANDRVSKFILLHELKQIQNKEFKIGFEHLLDQKNLNIPKNELCLILLNYFAITYLEKSFWRLKYKIENCKVIELEFQFKGLIEIPEAVQYLDSLKKLILRYNQITVVPKWIKNLKFLEVLNLNVNNLTKLPESVGSLSYLKDLSLWKNEIEALPNSIANLRSLETLNLRLNQLKELPSDIGSL